MPPANSLSEIAQDKIERLAVIDGDERLKDASLTTGDEVFDMILPAVRPRVEAWQWHRRRHRLSLGWSALPNMRRPRSRQLFFSLGGFIGTPTSFRFARGLPIKASPVGDAPASSIHVEAGAFALLPHRVESHAADALCVQNSSTE